MQKDIAKKLKEAIAHCAGKACAASTSGADAMHFTQAAANAAHALATLKEANVPLEVDEDPGSQGSSSS